MSTSMTSMATRARRRRVAVTGLGAVSAFGLGVARFWAALTASQCASAPIRRFDATKYRAGLAAEIPEALLQREDLQAASGHPLEDATLLATLAACEALKDAGLHEAPKSDFGCVVGTLCASARLFEDYCVQFVRGQTDDSQYPDVEACVASYQLEHLVHHFGLEGPSTLVSTACSSSTDAIGCATDMVRSGAATAMLAGGGDILAELAHAGFNTVFSLTQDVARPFDSRRTGFFIGEGAGMLVLEDMAHARQRGARIYAEVLGHGLSNAAHHLTATSKDGLGESLAILRCLEDAGIPPDAVDHVNAHGTATPHNDATEALALRRVFGSSLHQITVTSIKAQIGHCMGASGALEAVATVKAIEQGCIPPTLHSRGDLDPLVQVALANQRRPLRCALSQSFGFGGASSAVLFGAPPPDAGASASAWIEKAAA